MGKSYQHLKITSTSSPVSLPLLRIMDKVTSFHTPCPRGHEVKILVAQSCLTLYDPVDCSPLGSSAHGDSPGKNTGVGCHALLQGIFLTQELNIAGGFFTIWATRKARIEPYLALKTLLRCTSTRAFLVAQLVKNLPAVQETWVRSLGWEDPLEKGKASLSNILA